MINRKAYDSAIVALNLLVLWAGLSGIWNIYGGLQLLYGEQALGPTPGLTTAFFMFALAVGFIVTSSYWSIAYIALASFAGVMATMNILHITDGSSDSWMSTFWLYVAIVINVSGVVGAILAIGHSLLGRITNILSILPYRKSRTP